MPSASDSPVFCVDTIEIDVARGCLRRDGQEVHLAPKAFRLLVHLVVQRERLVAKEELMELFWKDTAVTDDALTQCIAEIRRALSDNPRNPAYVKTVPRRGYRFVGVVEERIVDELQRSNTGEASASEPPSHSARLPEEIAVLPVAHARMPIRNPASRRVPWVIGTALLAVSIGGAAFWNSSFRSPLPGQGKRQIAIMRFETRSGQPELDWLRDGLPEMLATTLSKSPALEILSRGQLYARASRGIKPGVEGALELARSTRASAAVVGSFSKLGASMRVDIQLYDPRNGSLLGAETITVEREDKLLAQIDFLAARLAQILAPQSRNHDRRELASLMTQNLEAYRYYTIGMEKVEAFQTAEAIALFEAAVKLDPGFVMAYARIGYAHAVTNAELAKGRPYLEKAFKMSGRLTEKDRRHIVAWYAIANQDYQTALRQYSDLVAEYPGEPEAYFRLAALLRGESRHEEAAERLRQAITMDPEDPKLYNALAAVSSEMGRHDDAIGMASRYVALAPMDPNSHDSLGLSYDLAGKFALAMDEYGQALERKPDFHIAALHRLALLAKMGRFNECVRESLALAESVEGHIEKRRGWDQAARAEWARGHTVQARTYAANAIEYHIEGIQDINPAVLLLPVSNSRQSIVVAPQVGRGSRYGERRVFYFLAQEHKSHGRNAEMLIALQQLLKARTGWGDWETYEDSLAEAYFGLGRMDDAIPEYERALRIFPGIAKARFHLAQAYQSKGRAEEAKQQYREFLGLWKQADADLPELEEARRFVESNLQ